MLILLSLILIAIGLAMYGIAYALFTDKAEDIVMLGVDHEKLTDTDGYKQHQGRFAILMGSIFLLVPVSLYIVRHTSIEDEALYLWLIVLAVVVIRNAIQVRAFYR